MNISLYSKTTLKHWMASNKPIVLKLITAVKLFGNKTILWEPLNENLCFQVLIFH